jgi:hypothetical protein
MEKLSCMRVCTAAGDTPRPIVRVKQPRAIWAVSEIENVRARNRLTGSRTRGSPQADQAANRIWAGKLFVSRRCND